MSFFILRRINFLYSFTFSIFIISCTFCIPEEEIFVKNSPQLFSIRKKIHRKKQARILQLQNIKQPWTPNKDNFSQIQQKMRQGKVLYDIPLQAYAPSIRTPNQNRVVLVGIENNSSLKAIFKPRRPAHQKAELAAFDIAQYLGMEGLIPPVIPYSLKGTTGILSYCIDLENENEQNPWIKKNNSFQHIKAHTSPESLNNFYAFAFVFGMWDLKWVNTTMVGNTLPYHFMCLDNESLMYPVYLPEKEHFFVCWKRDDSHPSSPYEDLKTFNPTILKKEDIPSAFESLKRFFMHDPSIKNLPSEEEKKEAILKKIEGYMWGRSSIPHYIGQKGWWIQRFAGYSHIIPPEVSFLSPFTIARFQELDKQKLKTFFQDLDPTAPVFLEDHYDAILARRDQLLKKLSSQEQKI
jgi:hypothetical protein